MPLVAGVDSSTQACKVVVCDAETGALVREGRAPHPDGTEVHPSAWERALHAAIASAGGIADVAALAVGGQQHGMVCLDENGDVVRPALLWNDTRSAEAAADLVSARGAPWWADATGSVPVASFTVTKLRWLRDHEPEAAARVAAVCLPHDWLTWRLLGGTSLEQLATDRSDASGTGYWSPATAGWLPEIAGEALGHVPLLPRLLRPSEPAGRTSSGVLVGPGCGDNAGAALGLGAGAGDVVVSVGTSGVACARADRPSADPTGTVAGFAAATGDFLPLVCTLNAARVLDAGARLLGVDHAGLNALALAAVPGAGGVVLVPWFEGERTPDRPDATARLHGMRLATTTPEHVARAFVEGLLCSLADAVDALPVTPRRVVLVGGGARSEAVRRLLPAVLGRPVTVPVAAEHVALGAARQAAWVLAGSPEPPSWQLPGSVEHEADPQPGVRVAYAAVRDAA